MKRACALLAAIWITPFGGYRFSSGINLDDPNFSKIDIADNPVYGLALGTEVPGGALELMWTHQETTARAIPKPVGPASEGLDLHSDQIHFNGLYVPPGFHQVQPYALAGLGVTHYSPKGDGADVNQFSWALGGGAMVPMTKRLSLRLEGKWNPALMNSSSGVFCSSASGRCFVSAGGDLIDQFDFTAGLMIRI